MSIVQQKSYVTLHYRLLLDEADAFGEIVSTFEDKPATVQLGIGQLAPALEARLLGLAEGVERTFMLAGEEAFGPRNPDLIQKLTRAALTANSPQDADYQPGDIVDFPRPDGGRYAGVLKEINADYALFDFNHPLAGKALRFDVKIIGVL